MDFHFNKKIFFIVIAVFLLVGISAKAATTLSLVSDSQQVYAGDTFTVDLTISSPNKSVNTVDGTIVFDKNILQVESIDTGASVFSLWPVTPIFDNANRQIKLTGGVPNGFQGQNGEVIQIHFRAENTGTAKIDFLDTFSVLLNDGLGTKINPYLEPATVMVVKKPFDVAARETFKALVQMNISYGYLPIISLVALCIAVILIILIIRSKKKAD